MQEEIIKKYFEAANGIVISEMYLNDFTNDPSLENLKKYNPGHLGASMSINFILANLYYFLNQHKLNSQVVIGTGHAGVSLMANLWLNGTLTKYYPQYTKDKEGLNKLINDFGTKIRSEINPEYPETIYDGGELGYSLGVAYGYAINGNTDLVPCIIGDGEAETGTITSSWQLAKLLNTKSKVLPIINLNGLKMGSNSYLSRMSREELNNYFSALGYQPIFVSTDDNPIKNMQEALTNSLKLSHPLIIFSSPKGYTITDYENDTSVHKNPLTKIDDLDKLRIIKKMLSSYDLNIFDEDNKLLPTFDSFMVTSPKRNLTDLKTIAPSTSIDEYVYKDLLTNSGMVFSPDEIYSNQFHQSGELAFELLNENVLEALYQGYTMAGGYGYYIAYEGFMPIISSMLTQYYKYLKQKDLFKLSEANHSLNYIVTSTCWENTYSHQNPDIANTLLEKEDTYYNVIYPKDQISATKWLANITKEKDKINLLTFAKRHQKNYSELTTPVKDIEIIKDHLNPDIILCATGDYMLDTIIEAYEDLSKDGINVKVIYITKPQILNINNHDALTEEEFTTYFNKDTPSVYLYCGYPSTIKALLYDRNVGIKVLGYTDGLSVFGSFNNNALSNKISKEDILDICTGRLRQTKTLKRRKEINE